MTGDRIAVIDLGSNTFHLLICEIGKSGSWATLHKEREYVKLAEGGIDIIKDDAIDRAIGAMTRFADLINIYEVKHLKAIGTAAMRESKNGVMVADKISSITGIPIQIIDGNKEAQYIMAGIRSALPKLDQYGLIMDIGGGSVEFILFKGDDVAFSESFKIGVAVLFKKYHQTDPIDPLQIDLLEKELDSQLRNLKETLRKTGLYYLIGASGSFEVLNDVLPRNSSTTHWAELDLSGITYYLDTVIQADHEARKLMPEIPPERLDYIVVAYILIRYLIKHVPPDKLYYCDFALKEGVVEEMIREDEERENNYSSSAPI
jgi:exopolyphosphatase/guanosine-5'-triphosphate,3'-diphosphate pyrophosphatase